MSHTAFTSIAAATASRRWIARILPDNGLPVFCSEWGTSDYNETYNNFTAADTFIAFLEARSMNWIHWSFSIKKEASAALTTYANPAGPWVSGDYAESGTYIKPKIVSPLLPIVYSGSMTMKGYGPVSGQYYAEATVLIKDASGNPVPNVKVAGKWSGPTSDLDTGVTGADGKLTVQSDKIGSGGNLQIHNHQYYSYRYVLES